MAYECVSHICSAICSCLLGFNFHQEQRPETLLIQTSSVITDTEAVPSSASASSSSPPSSKITYDVFLSFRGIDTRNNFTDHLYTALKQKGITTFRDNEELERGESIGPNLLKAIEESRYVIVVFSKNYADSAWCLDEIAKVSDCMNAMGQKVLPVFYHVDPTEIRRQTGDQFGKAFQKHLKRFKTQPEKVKRWRHALCQVGNLSGWHLQDGYESKVIQEIVEKIFTELNQITSISEGLVGMTSHLNEMLSYLDIGCPDVRIIGICGMGGIGKTTIAQVVFERVQAQFEGCCFLENVREVMEKQGAVHLQEQLLSNLLKCNVNVQNTKMGTSIMRQRLQTKMVLIILDDVDQEEQLEALCDRQSFGPGSRIIITSRDEHLLSAVEGDKVYNVNPLTDIEALELFSLKAFKKDELVGEEVLKLSEEFLEYANGLPLAIKVLGSSVKGRSVQLWLSALERLKKSPDKKIINVLRFSFDRLEPREQKFFLDIACFLKGVNIDRVRRILQGVDAHCPDFDIQVLMDKSMVTLFGKKLWMHDLMQELGKEIVRQECYDEPGNRSRLWLANEILHVLGRFKATSAVQSIDLQCPTGDAVSHSIDNAFSNMEKLRLLKICNVKISGNITYLSNKLQYLEWRECPLDSFPSEFQPDKLVELHICFSRINQLWKGEKGWRMLRLVDLSGSQYLISTPDFSQVPDLEKLVLESCTSLVEIHPSLGFLKKLISLNMRNCKSIESIPPFTTMQSLQILSLSLCSGLKKFPEVEGNMRSLLELHLDGTSIEELPPSIDHLTGLTMLNLTDCKKLLRLPSTIQCLTSLKYLLLSGCLKLDQIPENLNGMKCLETIYIGGTSIRELSFPVGMENLQYLSCKECKCLVSESCKGLASLSSLRELDLSYCNLMDGAFLNDLSSLISLKVLDLSGNCFVRLPESISQFSKLDTLKLSYCRQLELLPKKLPSRLQYVYAENCTSLMDYPNQIIVLNSSESGATIVNSLDSTDSSALAAISKSLFYQRSGEGFVELHSKHKYTDGKQVDHYMPLTDIGGIGRQFEVSHTTSTILPRDEIPEWFGNISTRNHISIPIPGNLTSTNKWKGLAACAVFSVKGHTALSIIEPDPDFSNYSYKITLETDVMSVVKDDFQMDTLRPFGSISHMLIVFNISGSDIPHCGLNESSVVRASFEITNPSMVVQKCAIRLLYDPDDGWFDRIFPEGRGSLSLSLNDVEKGASVSESSWLYSESGKWEILLPPVEEESTFVRTKNLESVLPRYLEALKSLTEFKFNLRGSPGWFHASSFACDRSNWSEFGITSMKLPQNLHTCKKWMGFAVYASLVEEVGMEEGNYEVIVVLSGGDKFVTGVRQVLAHLSPLSEEHHRLLVISIPRSQIPEEFLTRSLTPAMKLFIKIGSPHGKVQSLGYRIVYHKDIQGFADALIQCMKREGSLKSYDKEVVTKWIELLRLQHAHLERITKRDSRTPWEKQFELHSQQYRNWDWSNNSFSCGFRSAELSKWKWFMPFINRGNYVELQLPLNILDDDNWLGFATCSWLSHDQCPNITLGTALDSENVKLQIHLHSDVDWNGFFDHWTHTPLGILYLTWFCYIPCTNVCSLMWRQCKSARVTVRLINYPCLTVHSCALRLVYKEDVEHLVETLTLAELP